ncbi:hypothetical protein NHX12_026316, partial [Muraenolepis orangiensis]
MVTMRYTRNANLRSVCTALVTMRYTRNANLRSVYRMVTMRYTRNANLRSACTALVTMRYTRNANLRSACTALVTMRVPEPPSLSLSPPSGFQNPESISLSSVRVQNPESIPLNLRQGSRTPSPSLSLPILVSNLVQILVFVLVQILVFVLVQILVFVLVQILVSILVQILVFILVLILPPVVVSPNVMIRSAGPRCVMTLSISAEIALRIAQGPGPSPHERPAPASDGETGADGNTTAAAARQWPGPRDAQMSCPDAGEVRLSPRPSHLQVSQARRGDLRFCFPELRLVLLTASRVLHICGSAHSASDRRHLALLKIRPPHLSLSVSVTTTSGQHSCGLVLFLFEEHNFQMKVEFHIR